MWERKAVLVETAGADLASDRNMKTLWERLGHQSCDIWWDWRL